MTNHWNDLANSDCILMMGSNPAQNHPISFKWVLRAKDRGATLISVDPRFTASSSKADMYAPLRCGSDIAFLGGMINYILQNNKYFKEYILENTNAAMVVGEAYSFSNGLFSGFNAETRRYDKKTWAYDMDDKGVPVRDMTLQHPRCVFQLMQKHYSRYTIDKVIAITGTPKEDLLKVYEAYSATGARNKAGTIMYAMGWTQHSVGVQNIRTMAMIQLLLGNIGIAGGGVNALRGEANVQGSTDQAVLADIWPGYLPVPRSKQTNAAEYIAASTPKSNDPKSLNWKKNHPKYIASFLKSLYPSVSVDEAYSFMPRLDAGRKATDYFWMSIFDRMMAGELEGLFAWGMNPACSGPNANKSRTAFEKLKWLVNVNLFDNETGSFWRGPGKDPKKIATEVFFLPCCTSIEKEGSVSNSGRWMQWRYAGPKPQGHTLPDGDIFCEMAQEIRKLYAKEGGAFPDPVLKLGMEYWLEGHEFSPRKTARLLNGFFLKDTEVNGKLYKAGQLVPGFANLKDDGSTMSGNWLHCGSYTEEGGNLMMRRDKKQTEEQARIGLYPNWAFAWPMNRRIIYNRASVDVQGKPWNPEKSVIRWDGKAWQGDVVDGGGEPGSKYPFIMQVHGQGHLFGPGREDGPFPEHYEPMESPFATHELSQQRSSPVAFIAKNEQLAVADEQYPFIGTTYRVTEHWQTGLMTRRCAWLVEAEPQVFAEIDTEMAAMRGIANGDVVRVSSKRGTLLAKAVVSERVQALTVNGKTIHMVGLPWHFGWVVPKRGGDSANLLTAAVGDPNTAIPESKAFMVNIEKVNMKDLPE
jgi:formate dehydrogenase major subunit